MSKVIIKAENVSKTYKIGSNESYYTIRDAISNPINWIKRKKINSFKALNRVNFEINKGEVIGIIGKNGAGKSTLLKVLSKITPPTEGKITMKGRVASLLEVGTGFHPELTGRENIYLNGAILGMSRVEVKRNFDEIINFAEIENFLDTPVKRYSSGMYVRLAFAVAAHLEPEILIIDEVLAVGDAQFQKKCLGKIESVARNEGRTILFVSHNMAAIKQLCTKCIWIDKGRIATQGKTTSVVDKYLNESLGSGKKMLEKHFLSDTKKEFQVLSVSVKNKDGKIKDVFECDDPFFIILNCISRQSIPGLYGYLSLVKEGGEVLVSDTFDFPSNSLDSIPVGRYKIEIKIPPRTIGHGTYTIRLSFASAQANTNFFVDSPGNTVSFQMEDHTTQRGNSRAGYLSTLLEWKIENSKR